MKLSKSLITIIVVVAVAIIALVVYIFVVRPQDSDYTAASNQIDTMVSEASSIKSLTFNAATITSSELSVDKLYVDGYNQALTSLKKSAAMRDSKVAAYYKSVQGKIENYGQSSADLVGTIQAFANVSQTCSLLERYIVAGTTSSALATPEANCKNALTKYTSAPLKEFNKYYFQAYHGYMSDWLNAVEAYYTTAGGTPQQQAAITAALDKIGTLNQTVGYTLYLSPSADPTDKLSQLKTLLDQRRNTFFR